MELLYWMWLLEKKNIGCILAKAIVDYVGGIEKVYQSKDKRDFFKVKGINEEIANALVNDKDLLRQEKLLELMKKEKINAITIADEIYPNILKEIYAPPCILFYKGENIFSTYEPAIAVVGSRKATNYGLTTTYDLSRDLSHRGISVVSGLALGVDTAAHKGALMSNTPTIAVLGCGANIPYPASNRRLYNEIIENGGMIISEMFPETPPIAQNFPPRNRIISGLSLGSVIVEASKRSGSLITAQYAREQNREVYAVPGNISSSLSKGTNSLIREGAKLITGADDIIEDIYPLLKNHSIIYKKRKREKKDENYNESRLKALSEKEKEIYFAVEKGHNTIDLIQNETLNTVGEINTILTLLELKSLIKKEGSYIKINSKA